MKIYVSGILLLAALAGTSAVHAQGMLGKTGANTTVGGGTPVTVSPFYRIHVKCTVAGTPVEFPNDLEFINAGSVTIPEGRVISWRTHAPVYQATYRLNADLAPGAGLQASNVLPNGIEAGKPCTARVH